MTTYTETPARANFHAWVATLSGAVHGDFVLVPGRNTLYSHPRFPGVVFKAMDPLSGGRGLRGLAFVRGGVGNGAVHAVLGKSLDRVARNWTAPAEKIFHAQILAGDPGGGVVLGGSHRRLKSVAYFSTSIDATRYKEVRREVFADFTVTLNTANLQSFSVQAAQPITHVMEVVGNFDSGVFSDMIQNWGAIDPIDPTAAKFGYGAAPSGTNVAGYIGRTLNLGPLHTVLTDPKVKLAILNEYPEAGGIRNKAAELYDAVIAARPNDNLGIALYHDVKTRTLRARARDFRTKTTQGATLTTVDTDTGIIYNGAGHTLPPGSSDIGTIYNLQMAVPVNYGDSAPNLIAERWFLTPSELNLMQNVTGDIWGPFDLGKFQNAMVPLYTPPPSTVLGVATLDLMMVPPSRPAPLDSATPPPTLLDFRIVRNSIAEDLEYCDAYSRGNMVYENFAEAVNSFSNVLDKAVEAALE